MKIVDDQIKNVLAELKNLFSKDLLAVCLYGSYVDGGLKKESDIDFLVVINRDMTKYEKKKLISRIIPLSKRIGEENTDLRYIEITIINYYENIIWSYPPMEEFIYGEWLRTDYLNDIIPKKTSNVDLTILLYQIRCNSTLIYGDHNIKDLIPKIPFTDVKKAIKTSSNNMIKSYHGDEAYVILTLCRMILTVNTGKFYTKDSAGIKLIERLSVEEGNLLNQIINHYKYGSVVNWEQQPYQKLIHSLYNYLKNY